MKVQFLLFVILKGFDVISAISIAQRNTNYIFLHTLQRTTSSFLSSIHRYGSEASESFHNNGETISAHKYNLLGDSFIDHEKKPTIQFDASSTPNKYNSSNSLNILRTTSVAHRLGEWGIFLPLNSTYSTLVTPSCPNTISSVVNEAFHAITKTLYKQQSFDPNIITNVMAKSITEKRPVGFVYGGGEPNRLGVEIDGLGYFLNPFHNIHENYSSNMDLEIKALCTFTFLLAGKLAKDAWEGLEQPNIPTGTDKQDQKEKMIAVYFHNLRQALLASEELQLLKKRIHQDTTNYYKNIRILCIGQDEIPDEMLTKEKNNPNRRDTKKRNSARGITKPSNGMILVVRPSDLYTEFNPPSPAFNTLHSLQRLLAQATVQEIPLVVISPRLTESFELQDHGNRFGFDQSGYQKSTTYGGLEPPRGTTPWLLRDFIPPVYSFLGCALSLPKRNARPITSSSHHDENHQTGFITRVALTQSVCQSGHPWHLFAVETITSDATETNTKYHYLTSSKSSAGRPTKSMIRDVLSESKFII